MTSQERVLGWFKKIPYATVYNLQPWTIRESANLRQSLQWPTNIVKALRDKGLLQPVNFYPITDQERYFRFNRFYTARDLTREDGQLLYTVNKSGEMAATMAPHESGLADIFLAFINLYPDWEIEIDTKAVFPYRLNGANKKYIPDAVIRMKSPDLKTMHFIVEFERTKTHDQIKTEKFKVNEILGKPQNWGLSKYTKFLYLYSYELYDVYTRPLEYNNDLAQHHHKAIDVRLKSLIESNKINDRYRFLPFYDFHRLNESVWYNSQSKTQSIINFNN